VPTPYYANAKQNPYNKKAPDLLPDRGLFIYRYHLPEASTNGQQSTPLNTQKNS
jgi:hypothetical protein